MKIYERKIPNIKKSGAKTLLWYQCITEDVPKCKTNRVDELLNKRADSIRCKYVIIKCLRRYRQRRSQRALHAGMEMFSWGEKGGRVRWGQRGREIHVFSQKKSLRGFCLLPLGQTWMKLSRSLVLSPMSGLYLTLKPECLLGCACQTERTSLDVSVNQRKQNTTGH